MEIREFERIGEAGGSEQWGGVAVARGCRSDCGAWRGVAERGEVVPLGAGASRRDHSDD